MKVIKLFPGHGCLIAYAEGSDEPLVCPVTIGKEDCGNWCAWFNINEYSETDKTQYVVCANKIIGRFGGEQTEDGEDVE